LSSEEEGINFKFIKIQHCSDAYSANSLLFIVTKTLSLGMEAEEICQWASHVTVLEMDAGVIMM